MTKIIFQAAAAVLAALMTLAVVAGANGIAKTQYVAAERVAWVSGATLDVAVQRVVVIGRRAQA